MMEMFERNSVAEVAGGWTNSQNTVVDDDNGRGPVWERQPPLHDVDRWR